VQPIAQGNIRLAATVVLLRPVAEGAAGYEIYMVERPGGTVFPDLHVFPGGKVDESDFVPEHCLGLTVAAAEQAMGVPGALRYWVAAIRECFEECGVLLATQVAGGGVAEQQAELAHYRQRCIDGNVSIGELCNAEGLQLDCAKVHYFSHWLTPEVAPKRFDTRFFVAELPPKQLTQAHDYEVVAGVWVTPEQALENAAQGVWQMISPTLVTLESLARYQTIPLLLEAVALQAHLPTLTKNLLAEGMCELR
jgi:8-oxo-dGTP pyrophosphatase MutT (NUDIX family)